MKEQYGLEFIKINNSNGEIKNYCRRKDGIVDQYNELQFLSRLNVNSTIFLKNEIERVINNNSAFFDYVQPAKCDDIELIIDFPNFNINDMLILPLTDIKTLLEEWLDFIS